MLPELCFRARLCYNAVIRRRVKFFRDEAPANPDASVDEIFHTNDAPALDVTVSAAGTTEHTVDPGNYTIMVNVLKTTTGTIIISAK